jgi:sialic acid synthase SpsE
MDIAAVSLGADIIEKTITLDRAQKSCEHMMSLEPQEMGRFVQIIRDLETAFGNPRRIMTDEEIKKRDSVRRSAHLTRDIKEGHRLEPDDIEFRRPGYGIKPDEYRYYIGTTFRQNFYKGHMLTREDFA